MLVDYIEIKCASPAKEGEDWNVFNVKINFAKIDWYTETEAIVKGEATNLIKFGIGFFQFYYTDAYY